MKTRTIRNPLLAVVVAALILSTLPLGLAIADPIDKPGPIEATLDHLSEILKDLEGELSALEAPRAERLEEGLEELTELISSLLEEFDHPREEGNGPALKARIIRLDLMLHRLISVLDGLLAGPEQDGPKTREAIDDLRNWVTGYIDGLSAGMDDQAAERLEQAVHEMVRDLAQRVAQITEKTRQDAPEFPKLERLVAQLENLVARLDGFIRQRFPMLPNRPR
ncbi:hypothetical protein ACFLSZ_04405 [Candidatus Bipolaricaulota bacterium]